MNIYTCLYVCIQLYLCGDYNFNGVNYAVIDIIKHFSWKGFKSFSSILLSLKILNNRVLLEVLVKYIFENAYYIILMFQTYISKKNENAKVTEMDIEIRNKI